MTEITTPEQLAYAIRKKKTNTGMGKNRAGFDVFCKMFMLGDWSPANIKRACHISMSTAQNWLNIKRACHISMSTAQNWLNYAKDIAPEITGEVQKKGAYQRKEEKQPSEPMDFTSLKDIRTALKTRAEELFNMVSTPGELKQLTDTLGSIIPELKMADPHANKNLEILVGKEATYESALKSHLQYLSEHKLLPEGIKVEKEESNDLGSSGSRK
jgi:hypothetical protein